MRGKIAILTTLVIILNCVFCYADNGETISVPNQVYMDLRNEFDYDEKTDTYYFPINDIDELSKEGEKSATVAVSGAVISSVLALAVKAGLEFATTNSMSEFVSRFFMLDGISSVVSGLNETVKNSINGTLDFSRSLLDTVSSKFAELMNKGDIYATYVKGKKFVTISHSKEGSGDIDSSLARYIFETSTLPRIGFYGEDIVGSKVSYYYDTDLFLPIGSFGNFSAEAYANNSGYDYVYFNYKKEDGTYSRLYSQYSYIRFSEDIFAKGYRIYVIPYLSESSDRFYVGAITAVYSTVTGFLHTIEGTTTYGSFTKSHVGNSSVLPVIGDSWSSGSIPGTDDTYESGLNIGVPKDTNVLVNKTPSDVVSTPSYEIWTPGTTVVTPNIDTGTGELPDDTIYPPIVDNPGDSGTDTPSNPDDSSSISWDWLKELLNKLLEMIETIIDWLTNFWDKLLEFIQGLVVPGEDYFVEEFGKITEKLEEKVPSVDIA